MGALGWERGTRWGAGRRSCSDRRCQRSGGDGGSREDVPPQRPSARDCSGGSTGQGPAMHSVFMAFLSGTGLHCDQVLGFSLSSWRKLMLTGKAVLLYLEYVSQILCRSGFVILTSIAGFMERLFFCPFLYFKCYFSTCRM